MPIRVIRGSACVGVNLPCVVPQPTDEAAAAAAANSPTYGLRLRALAGGTGRGSGSTSVLLFSTAPTSGDFGVPTARWLRQTNSPTLGTSFQILAEGTYQVSLMVASNSVAPSDSPTIGISLDATGAVLTSAPLVTFDSIQASTSEQDASLPSTLFCGAPIYVPASEIAAGRGFIRVHASPSSPLIANFCMVVIRRVNTATIPS